MWTTICSLWPMYLLISLLATWQTFCVLKILVPATYIHSFKIFDSYQFLSLTFQIISKHELPHDKTNKMSVRPAKTKISLGIHPVWSVSSMWARWVAKDPSFLHAASEDSDQTGLMPRMIWVFAGHTVILLVFVMRRLTSTQTSIKNYATVLNYVPQITSFIPK